ncbi:hypothetical protein DL96DRAFT_1466365, partial [Flagelloscypha sp. PMI_526]
RRTCTPNTRINVLQEILLWAKDISHPLLPSLFWIFGLAGTGKSTIAQSVCEILKEEGLLASSYFCSLQLDSKDSKRIVPTIVSHLAARFPVFGKHLASILCDDPHCASSRISDQFRDLLCTPWALVREESAQQRPFVVVIDALDECDDGEEMLRLILDAVDHNQLQGIRFLATSRPVPRLVKRALEMKRGPHIALHEVIKEEVSGDIGRFLEEQLLGKIDGANIHELTTRSDGLFIFASTLVKHLVPTLDYMPPWEVQERLRQILKPRHHGEEVGLYDLYNHILYDALSQEKLGPDGFKQRLLIVQTVVSMEQATTACVISDFLGYDIEDVIGIVNSLHSVLFTRGSGEPIYVIHATFRDFIVSLAQEPFRCDAQSVHHRLTQSCLARMQVTLKFNICNIESSFTINDDLSAPLDSIGEPLAYACQYWWAHLKRCAEAAQNEMRPNICQMLEKKGLFWIEVMTLLGDERHCRDILKEIAMAPRLRPLEKLLPGIKRDSFRLKSLALEAAEMVSIFMSISPRMTSHLYISILSLWEGDNLECWKSQFRRLPYVHSHRIDGNRNTKLILNVGSRVHCVAFSPDSKHIVSGSWDNSARVWDAESGKQLCLLDGHESLVISVAFSPDSKYVVSGSDDNTVRIWDAESGKQLRNLDGHVHAVTSVAFSPDGKGVVSGSWDRTVQIWDAESSKQLRKLDGHGSPIRSPLSPSLRMVSVSSPAPGTTPCGSGM